MNKLQIITQVALIIFFSHLLFLPLTSKAQEGTREDSLESITPVITPIITSEDFVQLDKPALFDASDSVLLPDPGAPTPTYWWTFSDTLIRKSGNELVRSFSRTGKYSVNLTIQQGSEEMSADKEIFVYDKRILLITNQDIESGISEIDKQAAENGVLMETIAVDKGETEFLTEESLVKSITEKSGFIDSADALIFYTRSSIGLKSFTRYWQSLTNDKRASDLQQKFYVVITDEKIEVSAGIVLQNFKVIKPAYILLTRREALNPIFEAGEFNSVTTVLENRAIEHRIIDERSERSAIFLLSRLVTQFVAQGVPSNTIYIILAFPFIALTIAFAREVIGISAFGVYTPAMIATAFLILGINFGLVTLAIVLVAGWGVRWVLNRIELLYIPRTALVLSSIAISFLVVIWFLLYYGSSVAISLAIFPMLVMSTMTEKFLSAQQEEGVKYALLGVLQTIIVVIGAYYLVTWHKLANLLTSTPELVILPLLVLILLGRFTGLRLSEYFRFRSLLREGTEE